MNPEIYEKGMSEEEAVQYTLKFHTESGSSWEYITKLIYWHGVETGEKYIGDDPVGESMRQLAANELLYRFMPGYMADVWRAAFIVEASKPRCPHCGREI